MKINVPEKNFDKRDERRSAEQVRKAYCLIRRSAVYFMACRSPDTSKTAEPDRLECAYRPETNSL
jgi:hypothetical protein